MSSTKLRRTLALVLAGGSLAIGVPAALAGSGGDGSDADPGRAPATLIQQEGEQPRPDREDCPERDGNGNGNGGGSDESGATQAL